MARFRRCRECGGRGKADCWACGGTEQHPSQKRPDDEYADQHCPECIDGTEVCLECSGDGGEYVE